MRALPKPPSPLRSRDEEEERRRLARALERGLRARALPFAVAHVEVHAMGGGAASYHALLEVPLEHRGTPQAPEVVARGWVEALSDLTVDRGAFPAEGTARGPACLSEAATRAAVRLYATLWQGLRDRALPFALVTCAMREDGSAYGVVDLSFEYAGPRQGAEDLAASWLDQLVNECSGGKP